ncbi:MAG: right-handed parallel beta-helix repeat-containing protein [Actinomycetota bacterium]|nr:right-handed parallel beta-helix repeat-containing protein [Actinomycetota bacterium]
MSDLDRRHFLITSALAGAAGAIASPIAPRVALAQDDPPHEQDTTDVHGIADTARLVVKGELMHNVRDFGAVGDGVTNDSEALRQAQDQGGILFFPPGTYLVNPELLAPRDGALWVGAGSARSVIKLADGTGGYVVDLNTKRDVEIRDLGIDGNRAAASSFLGIRLIECARIRIERVWLFDVTGTCVGYEGANADVVVRGCRMTAMGSSGINGIDRTGASLDRFAFENNFVTTGAGDPGSGVGIQAYSGSDGAVSGNVVDGETGQFLNGIMLRGCRRVRVLGNVSRRNRHDGLTFMQGCESVVVVGNVFTDSYETSGIFVIDGTSDGYGPSRGIVVTGNSLDANHLAGIRFGGGFEDSAIEGNSCSRNARFGIVCPNGDAFNVRIRGNVVAENGEAGILAAGGRDLAVEDNSVRNNGFNTSTPASRSGIFFAGVQDCSVVGNRCIDHRGATQTNGIELSGGCSRINVMGNVCQGNRQVGILLDGATDCMVHDNRVEGNSQAGNGSFDGIQLVNGAIDNSVQGNQVRAGTGRRIHNAGIAIESDGCLVMNNDLLRAGGTSLRDLGTDTIAKDNRGVDL